MRSDQHRNLQKLANISQIDLAFWLQTDFMPWLGYTNTGSVGVFCAYCAPRRDICSLTIHESIAIPVKTHQFQGYSGHKNSEPME
jgi:hypothetical protein